MTTKKRVTSKASKARNEKTSKRVASIAGKVLTYTDDAPSRDLCIWWLRLITVGDLRALAASCLTQAPNK